MSVRNFYFLSNGSSTTLSPSRSGESCLSKDQKKAPLTSPIEVNQTKKLGDKLEVPVSF